MSTFEAVLAAEQRLFCELDVGDVPNIGEAPPVVLVVDDDASIRRLLQRSLRSVHLHAVATASGQDALLLMRHVNISVAVVDLGLPDCDGFDLVRKLRSARGTLLHIVVLSGEATTEARMRAFDAGANDFVAKPCHVPELGRRLQAAHRQQMTSAWLERECTRTEKLRVFSEEAFALLAHDLNNGFAAALANVEYLDFACQLDGTATAALDATRLSLERMASLVANFLECSRMEDGGLRVSSRQLQMLPFLEGIADVHRAEILKKPCTLDIDCRPEVMVQADPCLLERTMHNLIGNAIRFVEAGGHICISVYLNSAGRPTVCVANDGPPVPLGLRPVLFDKYATGEASSSLRGMGLYFCRLAVEAHGGEIGYDYSGGFCRFFFTLGDS